MEKITDASYREMGRLVDDSIDSEQITKEYFVIDMSGREYVFSFEGYGGENGVCLLFAALKPLYHDSPNDFSQNELEKYIWKIEVM